MRIVVPGAACPQPRQRFDRRRGVAYLPSAHAIHAFKLHVQLASRRHFPKPLGGDIEVALCFRFRKAKGSRAAYPPGDVDNLAKGVLDALNGVAWVDDRQVCRLVVERAWGERSETTIEITEKAA